jgi:DNA-binding Xre family transcriptional regulator
MYFENKKAAQIAEETGINRASVSRTVLRAQNKLHSALKYAVMYITDFADAALVPAALQKSAQTASAMRMKPKNLSERLFALRASRGISEKVLARALEIPHERINKLEAGSECASADEITRYCAFFSVSADTLLGIV